MWKRNAFFVIVFLLSGCSNITILDPKSETGKDQAYLIWFSLAIMSLVLLTVFVLFTIFVFKYREKKQKGELPKDIKGHLKLELTWTIIPIVLLLILAIPTVKITMDQSPSTKASQNQNGIHINVEAKQFEWAFQHENGKKATNKLVLPEEESIILHLKSEDVIHSFWVPELAGKVDVFPNKELTYVIEDPEIGQYDGKCAEFCGTHHAKMIFDVEVVSMTDYESYINEKAD